MTVFSSINFPDYKRGENTSPCTYLLEFATAVKENPKKYERGGREGHCSN
jgi:hypothetical protein